MRHLRGLAGDFDSGRVSPVHGVSTSTGTKPSGDRHSYPQILLMCSVGLIATADLVGTASAAGQTGSALLSGALAFHLLLTLLAALFAPTVANKSLGLRGVMPGVWIVWLGWCMAVSLYFGVSSLGIQNLLLFFILVAGMWAASVSVSAKTPELVTRLILGAGAVLAVLFSIQLLRDGFNARGLIGRRSFGMVAIVPLAFIASYWKSVSWQVKVLGVVLFIEIAASGARTALALAVVVLAISVIAKRIGPIKLALGSLVACVSLALLVLYWPPLTERFIGGDSGLTVGRTTFNTAGRSVVWSNLYTWFLENPLGSGVGRAQRITVESTRLINQPHNDYLRLLVDLGIPGFALWMAGSIVVLMRLTRSTKQLDAIRPEFQKAALLVWISFLGFMLTDNNLVYIFSVVPTALVVGLALGMSKLSRKAYKC